MSSNDALREQSVCTADHREKERDVDEHRARANAEARPGSNFHSFGQRMYGRVSHPRTNTNSVRSERECHVDAPIQIEAQGVGRAGKAGSQRLQAPRAASSGDSTCESPKFPVWIELSWNARETRSGITLRLGGSASRKNSGQFASRQPMSNSRPAATLTGYSIARTVSRSWVAADPQRRPFSSAPAERGGTRFQFPVGRTRDCAPMLQHVERGVAEEYVRRKPEGLLERSNPSGPSRCRGTNVPEHSFTTKSTEGSHSRVVLFGRTPRSGRMPFPVFGPTRLNRRDAASPT